MALDKTAPGSPTNHGAPAGNGNVAVRLGSVCFSSRRPLDGPIGTELLRRGATLGEALARWTDTRPDEVAAIHRAYAEAGAQWIATNAFLVWAEPDALALAQRAVKLAREAAPGLPVALSLAPGASPKVYQELVEAAEVEIVLLETFTDLAAALSALEAVQKSGKPVVVSLVFDAEGRTLAGKEEASVVARRLWEAGTAGIGVNCQPPLLLRPAIEAISAALPQDFPILVRPSAGKPEGNGESSGYQRDGPLWAAQTAALSEGRTLLRGGCCGVGPDDIAELNRLLHEGGH
jgi:5-methyltetrahydrofolate--homocysteine methyltransferase